MTPFAYAVVNDQGYIAGAWRDKSIAENILAKGVPAHNEKIVPLYTAPDWLPMVSAPLDGTKIEILVRHFDYWTALKFEGKEKADARWQGPCRGHWIDHNGGGWTWRGIAGSPVGWRPLKATTGGQP